MVCGIFCSKFVLVYGLDC
jgi:hypothetical protein